jgi:hypothetical protein
MVVNKIFYYMAAMVVNKIFYYRHVIMVFLLSPVLLAAALYAGLGAAAEPPCGAEQTLERYLAAVELALDAILPFSIGDCPVALYAILRCSSLGIRSIGSASADPLAAVQLLATSKLNIISATAAIDLCIYYLE